MGALNTEVETLLAGEDLGEFPSYLDSPVEQQELQDVAANAATLRERLRVETHVRLASSKPLLAQDDVRYTMLDIGEWNSRLEHNESYETIQRLKLACAGLPEDFNALPHK